MLLLAARSKLSEQVVASHPALREFLLLLFSLTNLLLTSLRHSTTKHSHPFPALPPPTPGSATDSRHAIIPSWQKTNIAAPFYCPSSPRRHQLRLDILPPVDLLILVAVCARRAGESHEANQDAAYHHADRQHAPQPNRAHPPAANPRSMHSHACMHRAFKSRYALQGAQLHHVAAAYTRSQHKIVSLPLQDAHTHTQMRKFDLLEA